MSIEIYNKARIVRKNNKYYYFLKYHSKNDCICGGQDIVDDNFNTKFIYRNSRAGDWNIKAIGTEQDYLKRTIGRTRYNCPTSSVYGQIRFGNKKNIALYWVKKVSEGYEDFTPEQQKNIDDMIRYAEGDGKDYVIKLWDMKEKDKMKAEHTYCSEKVIKLAENSIFYQNELYWNLDNL